MPIRIDQDKLRPAPHLAYGAELGGDLAHGVARLMHASAGR